MFFFFSFFYLFFSLLHAMIRYYFGTGIHKSFSNTGLILNSFYARSPAVLLRNSAPKLIFYCIYEFQVDTYTADYQPELYRQTKCYCCRGRVGWKYDNPFWFLCGIHCLLSCDCAVTPSTTVTC